MAPKVNPKEKVNKLRMQQKLMADEEEKLVYVEEDAAAAYTAPKMPDEHVDKVRFLQSG